MGYLLFWLSRLVLFASGPVLLAFGLTLLYRETRCRRWTKKEGIIVQARVERQLVRLGVFQHVAFVTYQYPVGASTITASASLSTTGSYTSAQNAIRKYPVGARLTALVNPANALQ